jgi:uncharacterized membrane protein YhaH (DUF805 family)
MNFGQAIATCFRKYFDFRGYASRPEYWWFALFSFLGSIVANVLDTGIGASMNTNFSLLNTLWALAVLLPGLAVLVRRLRDAGYAWPWIFIALVPIAGGIILIVLLCQPTRQRVAIQSPAYSSLQ